MIQYVLKWFKKATYKSGLHILRHAKVMGSIVDDHVHLGRFYVITVLKDFVSVGFEYLDLMLMNRE